MATTKIKIVKGGGEDPPAKKNVYTSQEQINKANEFARAFLQRRNAPEFLAKNTVVARNIGDPVVPFERVGAAVNTENLQTVLPTGIRVEDVVSTKDGQYGYFHPQNGNFVPVNIDAILGRYKSATPPQVLAKNTKLKITK